jgi:hypothetical protein
MIISKCICFHLNISSLREKKSILKNIEKFVLNYKLQGQMWNKAACRDKKEGNVRYGSNIVSTTNKQSG